MINVAPSTLQYWPGASVGFDRNLPVTNINNFFFSLNPSELGFWNGVSEVCCLLRVSGVAVSGRKGCVPLNYYKIFCVLGTEVSQPFSQGHKMVSKYRMQKVQKPLLSAIHLLLCFKFHMHPLTSLPENNCFPNFFPPKKPQAYTLTCYVGIQCCHSILRQTIGQVPFNLNIESMIDEYIASAHYIKIIMS